MRARYWLLIAAGVFVIAAGVLFGPEKAVELLQALAGLSPQ